VLIFYAWTAVASVGCLLVLLIEDWWWALIVTGAGLVVCTILTLAPLSRRKAAEAAVQSADPAVTSDSALAAFDALDAAAGRAGAPTEAGAEHVLGTLQDKQGMS
jgi:UDP-GlcNAc:undecaprenyl-phosphate GlcNAc-1-phosphate transferase